MKGAPEMDRLFTVKQARQMADKTQKEMANLLEIHENTYRRLEHHPEKISLVQAKRISEITKISLDNIFFDNSST